MDDSALLAEFEMNTELSKPTSTQGATASAAPSPGYETKDASLLAISSIAVFMILLIVGTVLIAGLYLKSPYKHAAANARQTSFAESASWKSSVENDQAALKLEAAEHLESYGWIDRSAGIVRIPISRAMELEALDAAKTAGPDQHVQSSANPGTNERRVTP
ncbi:MAG TPA: hypothetical protein VFT72_04175 [Opitutaceae bacterium]|nr:hypothetical protein [Opitutaceae bacterium]